MSVGIYNDPGPDHITYASAIGWTKFQMEGQTDGQTKSQTEGWTDGWMEGRTKGRTKWLEQGFP
jgi:hypothetical protein